MDNIRGAGDLGANRLAGNGRKAVLVGDGGIDLTAAAVQPADGIGIQREGAGVFHLHCHRKTGHTGGRETVQVMYLLDAAGQRHHLLGNGHGGRHTGVDLRAVALAVILGQQQRAGILKGGDQRTVIDPAALLKGKAGDGAANGGGNGQIPLGLKHLVIVALALLQRIFGPFDIAACIGGVHLIQYIVLCHYIAGFKVCGQNFAGHKADDRVGVGRLQRAAVGQRGGKIAHLRPVITVLSLPGHGRVLPLGKQSKKQGGSDRQNHGQQDQLFFAGQAFAHSRGRAGTGKQFHRQVAPFINTG